MNSACKPSYQLYCNITGQYTYLNGLREKGSCVCRPFYYWIGGEIGCTPQLTYDASCTITTNPLAMECLEQTDLYCNSVNYKCSCQSDYYWSYINSKCRKYNTFEKLI